MKVAPVTSVSPLQNDLLAALSPELQQRLFPLLQPFPLPLGKVLYESGDTQNFAYFLTDAIVSLLYVMQDGASAEISVVGKDGLVGIALLMGGNSPPWRAVVQSEGSSFRLPAEVMVDELERSSELLLLLLRYSQALITQAAQTAVCNRHHTLKQQLCRWLLMSLDRLPDAHVNMTQELIANMLGVHREGVTQAAGELQHLGLISYRRGHITVVDRPGLEKISCECYQVVKKETDRLMKRPPKRPGRVERKNAGTPERSVLSRDLTH